MSYDLLLVDGALTDMTLPFFFFFFRDVRFTHCGFFAA